MIFVVEMYKLKLSLRPGK